MLAKIAVIVIKLGNVARFGIAEKAHRPAGEDAAVAAKVTCPGRIGHFARQRLGDIDRIRVQAFGNKRDTARKIAVDRVGSLLARRGDARFKVYGQFVEAPKLVPKMLRHVTRSFVRAIARFV